MIDSEKIPFALQAMLTPVVRHDTIMADSGRTTFHESTFPAPLRLHGGTSWRGGPEGYFIMEVEFRAVVWYAGYRVSNTGIVQSCWKKISLGRYGTTWILGNEWHLRKSWCDKDGRPSLQLKIGNRKRKVWIERLVLEAFHGPCPPDMEACHDPDPNPGNCCITNLRWDTHKNNIADLKRHRASGLRSPYKRRIASDAD